VVRIPPEDLEGVGLQNAPDSLSAREPQRDEVIGIRLTELLEPVDSCPAEPAPRYLVVRASGSIEDFIPAHGLKGAELRSYAE